MMEIRNCAGFKVSLLNGDTILPKAQLPPLSAHSRSSSTPSLTPHDGRSPGSFSSVSDSPSPVTPSSHHSFDPTAHAHSHPHAHSLRQSRQQYFLLSRPFAKMDDQNASMYPPIPDATAGMPSVYPMPQHMTPQQHPVGQQVYCTSISPASEPSRVSTVSATSTAKTATKKNQYPCPMAKQFSCTDFFTTSGHAARHAKKHTGKKDAYCPECNKAFTRKDNMEQHRRTHQTGRGTSRTSTDDSKVKKSSKPSSRKSTIKPELEAALEQELANDDVQAQHAHALAAQAQLQAQQVAQQQMANQASMLVPTSAASNSPYFFNTTTDSGPIPTMPFAMPDLMGSIRPPLHRSSVVSSLEYVPPPAHMADNSEAMQYSYPSPGGLSHTLHSLALASEHRRLSPKTSQSRSPPHTASSRETP